MSLTRGERFKDARIVHNQHGKQSMGEVSDATKINKSLIQALEDDSSDRSVGYDKIIKLAFHYNVTTDYLLGLSNDPSRTPAATDDLHISAKAVKQLRFFACVENHADDLSLLMEDRLFWSIIREVIAFRKAATAEGIYDSILLKYHSTDDADCITEMASRDKMEDALSVAVSNESIDKTTRYYLSSLIYLNNLSGADGQFNDYAFVRNFVPSEIHEQRANKYLHYLLERVNPENPIHALRRVFSETAKAGHISHDSAGDAHYSSRKLGDDYNGNN